MSFPYDPILDRLYTSVLRSTGEITTGLLKKGEEQKREGVYLYEVFMKNGWLKKADILSTIAREFGVRSVDISQENIHPEIVKAVNMEDERKYGFLPFRKKNGVLLLAMANPINVFAFDALRDLGFEKFKTFFALPTDIWEQLKSYWQIKEEYEIYKVELGEVLLPADETAISILNEAILEKASDIHIEPLFNRTQVRYRISGILRHSSTETVTREVVEVIKAMASLKNKPGIQDGRFTKKCDGDRVYDFRISVVPVLYGDSVVVRIACRDRIKDLQGVGFSEENLELINRVVGDHNGLILVAGKTGSGKSTTMYSILRQPLGEGLKVITIEDPVELILDNAVQIEIKDKLGITFESVMENILLQDPDVVMIGELRNKRVAALAIEAGMTGHLVLSTLHADDVVGTLARLMNMGVDPRSIGESVKLIIVQRLRPRVCEKCGGKKRRCTECGGTGRSGRYPVHEILAMNDGIREALTKFSSREELSRLINDEGLRPFADDEHEKKEKNIITTE